MLVHHYDCENHSERSDGRKRPNVHGLRSARLTSLNQIFKLMGDIMSNWHCLAFSVAYGLLFLGLLSACLCDVIGEASHIKRLDT
jgi:hypothetical protein